MRASPEFSASLIMMVSLSGCLRTAVSDEERAIILTAEDLLPYGFVRPTGAVDETWNGSQWFDGSKNIDYKYETLDESEEMPFYLHVSVDLETSSADAASLYYATLAGFKTGAAMQSSLEHAKITESCDYGDMCALFLLSHDRRGIGNQFVLQVEQSTYSVHLVGLHFDQPEVWHEMIASKVAALGALRRGKRLAEGQPNKALQLISYLGALRTSERSVPR